jgi:hypothetical protein
MWDGDPATVRHPGPVPQDPSSNARRGDWKEWTLGINPRVTVRVLKGVRVLEGAVEERPFTVYIKAAF